MKTLVITLFFLLATTGVWAEDRVELEGTSIIGNRVGLSWKEPLS
jgi:hypothetical protein